MVNTPLDSNKTSFSDNSSKNNIYFLSDAHLGIPDYQSSLKREKLLVMWLDTIKSQAKEIYLLGDIFDFWFEYKKVVPKGYIRLLGKLSELTDSGIMVYYFTGNHDMWNSGYFQKEVNMKVYKKPIEKLIGDKYFMIGHGDGLGPDDKSYKIMKKIFQNKISQRIFSFLHPRIGISLAGFLSRQSRNSNDGDDYRGEDEERLVLYCKYKLTKRHYDYFVFGHRHIPLSIRVGENSLYVNTGDWIKNFSYAVYDGKNLKLEYFSSPKKAAHVLKT